MLLSDQYFSSYKIKVLNFSLSFLVFIFFSLICLVHCFVRINIAIGDDLFVKNVVLYLACHEIFTITSFT